METDDEIYERRKAAFRNKIEGRRVYFVKNAYNGTLAFILTNGEPEVISELFSGISPLVGVNEQKQVTGINQAASMDDFNRHLYGKKAGFMWTFLNL